MKSSRVLVIAEAGVNHNGELDIALQLIDAAAGAGADCVKFQTFKSDQLATASARKADYQLQSVGRAESQRDMLKRLEIPYEWYGKLLARCNDRRIGFLSSAFDVESLTFLTKELKLSTIKLGSGELTNAPLLYEAGRSKCKVIVSTGMGTLVEVERALSALACGYLERRPGQNEFADSFASEPGRNALAQNVTLLHCVTEYPAPFEDVNLRAMDTLRETFRLQVGYSDHSPGTAVAIAAVGRGAEVIEKHLTLDPQSKGPDHKTSIEQTEFKAMVDGIRQVEVAVGDGVKAPRHSEVKNIPLVRKSLVAASMIATGELFTEKNVAVKRPGDGRSPFEYWEIIGKPAKRDYSVDEMIA